MLLATVLLMACDKGDDTPKPIELTGGTSNSQTVYADETQKLEGIKFKATATWTATVSDVTGGAADSDAWLRLSAYGGKAGDVTLAILFDQNNAGKDRKAEIRISCGGTTITIVVEQKAINKPEDPNKPASEVRYIKKVTNKSPNYEGSSTFEYDAKMRIAKISILHTDNGQKFDNNIYFTYKDNTIILTRGVENGVEQAEEEVATITLNANGTAKQVVMDGEMHDYEPEVGGVKAYQGVRSSLSRSGQSRATTITKFKFICDYTYNAQGYVVKVDSSQDVDGTITEQDDFVVSWNNGNIVKVATTYDGSEVYDAFTYSNMENKPCSWDVAQEAAGEWMSQAFTVVGQLNLMGKQSKFLLSSRTSTDKDRSSTHNFTYTLDKEGYVIGIQEKGVGNSSYNATTTIEYMK